MSRTVDPDVPRQPRRRLPPPERLRAVIEENATLRSSLWKMERTLAELRLQNILLEEAVSRRY